MRFRTEVEIPRGLRPISHDNRIVTIGSCFSDAIGRRLVESGLTAAVNPMGVLFNPVSIATAISRALNSNFFTGDDLYRDRAGMYHALDFESRRQGPDAAALLDSLNEDFAEFRRVVAQADILIVTFGTAWCFRHLPTDRIVGNCHKLPDSQFERALVCPQNIKTLWDPIVNGRRVIFTVSPVRHLNDGLHGNTLSKANLHLGIDSLCATNPDCEYFPAFEALVDDLRDYRFYADDLKHPSAQGEEYVFEKFTETYFDRDTRARAENVRKAARLAAHRPILTR